MTLAAKRLYQDHCKVSGGKFGNSVKCVHCRWFKATNNAGQFGAAVMFGHFVNHFRESHQALYWRGITRRYNDHNN